MAEMPDGRQNYRMRDHIRKIMKTAAGLVLWAVLFVSFALPAAALDWDHPGFEMGHISTVYNIRNGMPYSEINAAAQTEDGFMYFGGYGDWSGTTAGLFPDLTNCPACSASIRTRTEASGSAPTTWASRA